jgi:hypothetical protein
MEIFLLLDVSTPSIMSKKLAKYYTKTDKPYVYADGVILEPQGKLVHFDQES